MKKRIIAHAALLACTLATAGCQQEAEVPEPVRPVISAVVEPRLLAGASAAGIIEPRFKSDLGFRVGGRLISRPVTWSSDNITGNVRIDISRDESTNWETVIASTPNDGSEPINVVGRATRRARVRVVSIDSPTVSDSSVANISIR